MHTEHRIATGTYQPKDPTVVHGIQPSVYLPKQLREFWKDAQLKNCSSTVWRPGETTTLYYPVGAYFQITEAQNCWRHCGNIFRGLSTPNPNSITRSLQGWRKKHLSLDQGLGKSLPTSTVLTTQMWKDERLQQGRIRPTLFLMRWFVWYPCKGRLEDLAWDCVYLVGF